MEKDELAAFDGRWVDFYCFDEEIDNIGGFFINDMEFLAIRGEDDRLCSLEILTPSASIAKEVMRTYTPIRAQVYYKSDSFFQGYMLIDAEGNTLLVVGDKIDLDDGNHTMIFQKEYNYMQPSCDILGG